ncbi:MFS transporter [Brevibacillus sp. B_LB10_24]|uniref:MFS transporter n=1 Tax=Brevibacillus sp. B_LB10_24 TaxID=3380645 RepID=UPI0038B82421
MDYLKRGTAGFRRANFALFAGGCNTFAVLYCTQPLLPEIAKEFHIPPAAASLSLSLATIALAVSMLFIGSLSEAWGRKGIMTVSLVAVSALCLWSSYSANFYSLLAFRIAQGVVLAGLPAIAMAYLGEEIEPKSLGVAMGLYISGNSIGGMGGRVITGMLTDFFDWRTAIFGLGVLGIAASLLFWLALPPSRNFKPRPLQVGKMVRSLASQMKEPRLLCLYGLGFMLMAGFVTLYNYIGFQLTAPPYSLSQTVVGWIFVVYIVGTFSSTWMGLMADKYGRSKVLRSALLIMLIGVCFTLSGSLPVKILGIAVFTFGFFGGHSIASSWVGKLAVRDKAQAASLYLFFYYTGSSIGGTVGGIFWTDFGWSGVVGMIVCFLVLAFLLLARLSASVGKQQGRPVLEARQ